MPSKEAFCGYISQKFLDNHNVVTLDMGEKVITSFCWLLADFYGLLRNEISLRAALLLCFVDCFVCVRNLMEAGVGIEPA